MAANPTLDTISVGAAGALGFAGLGSVPIPIAGTGGVEGVFGLHSRKAAWFGFVGGTTTYNTWSFGTYFGVSFNTPDSDNYRGDCIAVTLDLGILGPYLSSKITNYFQTSFPALQLTAPYLSSVTAGIASSLANMKGSITAWAATSGNGFGFTFAPDALGASGSGGAAALLSKSDLLQASFLHYWQYSPEDENGEDIVVDF